MVPSQMTVRAALKTAIERFTVAAVPSGALAAELLLMAASGRDRTWLYAHPEHILDVPTGRNFIELIEKRVSGIPTQYLTGRQEFWGLSFQVEPGVLIPRPETEHLIEVVLARIASRRDAPLRIADIGTGSGCIAVALAKELPAATILATDVSAPALAIARRNAVAHHVESQITFLHADLLTPLNPAAPSAPQSTDFGPFDIIVSNPPYISKNSADELPREVRDHEPSTALYGGALGFEFYKRLIDQAHAALREGGLLVLELGHNSLYDVRRMLEATHNWRGIKVTNDLAGIPRVISAQKK
jgi:release factor glutamine methyltransferase